jgi:DNA polymerase V
MAGRLPRSRIERGMTGDAWTADRNVQGSAVNHRQTHFSPTESLFSWLRLCAALLYFSGMRNVATLYSAPDKPPLLTRPLFLSLVVAGFPSPADDYLDRSLEPKHNDIVIAVLDGELTVKRLYRQGDLVQLRPANPHYPIITIHADQELLIWGVVTGSIRQFNR